MAMTYIQQTIWAKTMIALLRTKLVAAQICNRNIIQGKGDEWRIILAGEVTTGNYDEDTDITYQETSDDQSTVTPNIDKYCAMLIKDKDLFQTEIPWQNVMAERSTYVLLKALDTAIFGVYGDAGSDFYSSGTTAWQFTVSTCAEVPVFFAKLTKAADDLDWPDDGRYVVGPSGFGEAINTYSGKRTTDFGDSTLQRGAKGFPFMGWEIFISNCLTTASSVTHGLAGVKGDGIGLGMQVDPASVESMRAEGRFGDLVRARLKGAYKVYRSTTVIDVNFNSTVVATS